MRILIGRKGKGWSTKSKQKHKHMAKKHMATTQGKKTDEDRDRGDCDMFKHRCLKPLHCITGYHYC